MATEVTPTIKLQTDLFIEGEFVPSGSGKRFATVNPATGETLAEGAEASREDLDRAVAAARRALESGPWAAMKPRQRGRILMRAAELLLSRAEQFGRVETLDNGKPIFEAAKIDMPAAAECLSYFGEYADKLYGDTFPPRTDAFLLTLREPVGVVGAITPWNFPLLQAMWKIAPALALGNSVVLKPASVTPLTTLRLPGLLADAGVQRRPRSRLDDRRGDGAAPGNRQDLLPRGDGTRQVDPARRRRHSETRFDGARRQVSQRRLRRRGSRGRRARRGQRDLLRKGGALLRRIAPARGGEVRRGLDREGGGA